VTNIDVLSKTQKALWSQAGFVHLIASALFSSVPFLCSLSAARDHRVGAERSLFISSCNPPKEVRAEEQGLPKID